jgi:hypothetical protein
MVDRFSSFGRIDPRTVPERTSNKIFLLMGIASVLIKTEFKVNLRFVGVLVSSTSACIEALDVSIDVSAAPGDECDDVECCGILLVTEELRVCNDGDKSGSWASSDIFY